MDGLDSNPIFIASYQLRRTKTLLHYQLLLTAGHLAHALTNPGFRKALTAARLYRPHYQPELQSKAERLKQAVYQRQP